MDRKLLNRILPFVVPVALLAVWTLATLHATGASLIPSPAAVWKAFLRLLRNGTLLENIGISTVRAFAGLALGGGIGFVLSVVNGLSPTAEKLLNTPVQMVRNVPYLAMMPLILVWLGIGEATKIVLVAIGTFFSIYLNTFHGIRYIDASLLEMAKAYGLRGFALFRHVIFPGAFPSILVGLRQSLGRMWVTLIVAETVAAKSGIGYMVTNAREYMLMDVIVLGVILYGILGVLSDQLASLLERELLVWRREGRN